MKAIQRSSNEAIALKVLICPNLTADPHSFEASLNWIKEIASICRKSDGSIELCIAIDNGNKKIVEKTGLDFPYLSLNTIDESALSQIRKKKFPFDAIFLKGHNHQIEMASKQLGVFLLAFGSAPWPLDVWVVEPTWPRNAADRTGNAGTGESLIDNSGGGSGYLGMLPLCISDYSRYAPYIGKASEFLYAPKTTCVLVPLHDHFNIAVGQRCLSRILVHINSLVDKYRDLFFMIAPMSKRLDRLKSLLSHSGTNTAWLNPASARKQFLSLTEKSAATLALDTTSALVPLLMGKPVCRETDLYGDFIRALPTIDDWLSGMVSVARMSSIGQRLASLALSYHIIPKCHGALVRYQTSRIIRTPVPINHSAYWTECRNLEKESQELRLPTAPAFVRKLRKLVKDPYAFCNDSRIQLIRSFRVAFKALGPVESVRSV
jgi:hypothetical protein